MLFIREDPVADPEAMASYSASNRANAGTFVDKYNLRPLAVYGAMEALEGEAPDGVVLLEFPSVEDARGWYESPEYQAAITLLNYRHVHRLDFLPPPVKRSLDDWNMDVYGTMQGPNEFLYTGNLKDWNRIPDMHRIGQPTLIVVGLHDELTPACAMRIHQALPDARVAVFKNSSHLPFWEEPDQYFPVLTGFLEKQVGRGSKPSLAKRRRAR